MDEQWTDGEWTFTPVTANKMTLTFVTKSNDSKLADVIMELRQLDIPDGDIKSVFNYLIGADDVSGNDR